MLNPAFHPTFKIQHKKMHMKILHKYLLVAVIIILSFPLHAQTPVYPESFIVAQDGSGNYKTIQEAVNAVRDLSQVQVKIFIKKGIYHEKLVVPSWKTMISLIGESKDSTIITGNDYSGKNFPGKDWNGRDKYVTYTSYTVLVVGNDFHAENLTIENTAGRVGQAVALHVEGDRCSFENIKLLGNQDTLYTATENSRQYYKNCLIEGTTDFIFGEATCVFDNCIIKSKTSSYITAASTSPRKKFGYIFFNCKLVADSSFRVYLGRPWRPYAKTVFINTEMGSHILPEGWDNWRDPKNETKAFYAEYGSSGQGGNVSKRVAWSHQLNKKQIKEYSLKNIFGDWNAEQVISQ
ncbi:MAG: Pectinesterase [Chitinophagaceae bacterium]|nr:Pectinesterase [Chitinophagaceae bacterium]